MDEIISTYHRRLMELSGFFESYEFAQIKPGQEIPHYVREDVGSKFIQRSNGS